MLGKAIVSLGESVRNRFKNAVASILPSKKDVNEPIDASTATLLCKADLKSENSDCSESEDASRTNLVINTDDHTLIPLYAVSRRRNKRHGKNKKQELQGKNGKKSVVSSKKASKKPVNLPRKWKTKKDKKNVKNQFSYKTLKTSPSTCSVCSDSSIGGTHLSASDHAEFSVFNDDDDGFVTSTSWEYQWNKDET